MMGCMVGEVPMRWNNVASRRAQFGAMPEQEDIASHFRYLLGCDFVKVTETSLQ